MAYYSCSILLCISAIIIIQLGIILKLYLKLTTKWNRSTTCLVGKTVIITGANSGIGYETALDMAMRGAKVILACIDQNAGESTKVKIIAETGNENIHARVLDLASFKSVREFAKNINETEERLDILINNAGAYMKEDLKSEDGHILLMQVNYCSHFLLTHLLLDLLKKSGPSRIINMASLVAKWVKHFDVNQIEKFPGADQIYYHTKLCMILFTRELAFRLKGTQVTTYSLHPGITYTGLLRDIGGFTKIVFNYIAPMFIKTAEEGAQTTNFTAVAKGIENLSGEHFAECARVEPYKTVIPGIEKDLWEKTIDVVQIKPEEIKI